MIRTKGEPGTGDVVQAVRHMRMMQSEIRRIASMAKDELFEVAKQLQVPYDLVCMFTRIRNCLLLILLPAVLLLLLMLRL